MKHPKRLVLIFLVIFLLVGLWATRSLPGDFLYQFKVSVDEPLIKQLYITKERKAMYEVSLVQKRMSEALHLARRGQLDEDSYNAWKKAFVVSTLTVNRKISSLRSSNDYILAHRIASQEQGVLEAYVFSLPYIQGINKDDAEKLLGEVKYKSDEIGQTISGLIDNIDQFYPKQQYLSNVEQNINNLEVYVNEAKKDYVNLGGKIVKPVYLELSGFPGVLESGLKDAYDLRATDFYPAAGVAANKTRGAARELIIICDELQN